MEDFETPQPDSAGTGELIDDETDSLDSLSASALAPLPATDASPSAPSANKGESISFQGLEIPIIRAGMPDFFVALKPPKAEPYLMVPKDAQSHEIVNFFSRQAAFVLDLRSEMLKRYQKSPSLKCHYQTGDVAYVMGRPFQLRVYPLSQGGTHLKNGARGRSTAKYQLNAPLSLLTLYVVHPRNFDEAKRAFNSYAHSVLLHNACGLAQNIANRLSIQEKLLPIRMRDMRGRYSAVEAGALWLSNELIPYPPDCLVYTLFKEIQNRYECDNEEARRVLENMVPGWKEAKRILSERPEPFSLQ